MGWCGYVLDAYRVALSDFLVLAEVLGEMGVLCFCEEISRE